MIESSTMLKVIMQDETQKHYFWLTRFLFYLLDYLWENLYSREIMKARGESQIVTMFDINNEFGSVSINSNKLKLCLG